MNNIAIFASGSGTNAENIINYFSSVPDVNVCLVLSNNPNAGVLERARKHHVDTFIFNRETFYNTEHVINELKKYQVDYVILAGFLWLVPLNMVNTYPDRIINIHPALLPKYGGKGMYGNKVHKAVIENGELQSGITIHYVNLEYDKGNIIFQATCPVHGNDEPDDLAARVHDLEYQYFPGVIEKLIREGNL